jgi:hypothetical protein
VTSAAPLILALSGTCAPSAAQRAGLCSVIGIALRTLRPVEVRLVLDDPEASLNAFAREALAQSDPRQIGERSGPSRWPRPRWVVWSPCASHEFDRPMQLQLDAAVGVEPGADASALPNGELRVIPGADRVRLTKAMLVGGRIDAGRPVAGAPASVLLAAPGSPEAVAASRMGIRVDVLGGGR